MATAVYPGSFDPISLGHLNIIRRASRLFDEVHVVVMKNSSKTPYFSIEERIDMIKRCVGRYGNVTISTWADLVVTYCKSVRASVILRGLRAVSDFDYEFQIALANRKIEPEIETVFMAADEKYTYLSSSVVREMARYGADISGFVPREILDEVRNRIN